MCLPCASRLRERAPAPIWQRMSASVPPPGYVPPSPCGSAPAAPPPAARPEPARRAGRPILLAAAVGIAAMAGVVFVLFGSTANPLANEIARAAAVSGEAPGYRINMGLQMSVPGVAAPITGAGSGVLDLRDRATSMSFALDFSQIPQAAQALGSTTMQMSMIVNRSAIYMQFPSALATKIPGLDGRTWVKMDLAKLSGIPGLSSMTSNPTMNDPSQMLRYLRAASDSVSNEGHAQVDGFDTTHYRAELSLDSLSNHLPAAERGPVEQALTRLRQATRLNDIPVDVWIDGRHFVRRMVMSVTVAMPNGQSIHETVTMDFSDYGPQPRPTPPPANEVKDLSEVIGGAGGLGTVTAP